MKSKKPHVTAEVLDTQITAWPPEDSIDKPGWPPSCLATPHHYTTEIQVLFRIHKPVGKRQSALVRRAVIRAINEYLKDKIG